MVKDHSDSEKGNPLPPHRLLFPINSKGSFICRQNTLHSEYTDSAHTEMYERFGCDKYLVVLHLLHSEHTDSAHTELYDWVGCDKYLVVLHLLHSEHTDSAHTEMYAWVYVINTL